MIVINKEDFLEAELVNFFPLELLKEKEVNDDDFFVQFINKISWENFKNDFVKKTYSENEINLFEKRGKSFDFGNKDKTNLSNQNVYQDLRKNRLLSFKINGYLCRQKENPMILNSKNHNAIYELCEGGKTNSFRINNHFFLKNKK